MPIDCIGCWTAPGSTRMTAADTGVAASVPTARQRCTQPSSCTRARCWPGLGSDDSPDFEEWLFVERERLHVLVIEAYADLAVYAEETGDFVAAGRSAERQIQLDPLREPAYRQQMRIFAKQGERSLALASFERCRKVLREELGLDPEAETLSLHAQLLAGEVVRQPGAIAQAAPPPDRCRRGAGPPQPPPTADILRGARGGTGGDRAAA